MMQRVGSASPERILMSDLALSDKQESESDGAGSSEEMRPPRMDSSMLDFRKNMSSGQIGQMATHTPVALTWENVCYSVTTSKGCGRRREKNTTHILKDLSGFVRPGEMLAIIGGSGAGKTTLLDILAQRKSSGDVGGDVCFNGTPGSQVPNVIKRISGYVPQTDIFKSELTVRETLDFQAELRLDPTEFSFAQRRQRVQRVMGDLGLGHRAEARVGNEERRGLSGGEKKRLAVGLELVVDPALLLLDEPTTGLDAFNALAVVTLLRDLKNHGKTIIFTIHQPRSQVIFVFTISLLTIFTYHINRGRRCTICLISYSSCTEVALHSLVTLSTLFLTLPAWALTRPDSVARLTFSSTRCWTRLRGTGMPLGLSLPMRMRRASGGRWLTKPLEG